MHSANGECWERKPYGFKQDLLITTPELKHMFFNRCTRGPLITCRSLLWLVLFARALGSQDIRLGVLTSWKGSVWDASASLLGVMPALDRINNDESILPNHTLSFVWADKN